MVANAFKGRRTAYLGIRSEDGRRSGILHVWTRRAQVYVAGKGQGGVDKISFHSPTYCQHAYDQNLPLPKEISVRQSVIWQRTPTPPPGALGASCAFTWQVPTDTLSAFDSDPPDNVQWIPAFPAGQVTILDMAFTAESEAVVRSQYPDGTIILFWPLSPTESFFVIKRSGIWDRETITVPASHHADRHLVMSPEDPENTGRPVTFSMFNNPTDGQALVGWELGGYWTKTPPHPSSSTLTRKTVVAKSP
jgi:hypothetical protein